MPSNILLKTPVLDSCAWGSIIQSLVVLTFISYVFPSNLMSSYTAFVLNSLRWTLELYNFFVCIVLFSRKIALVKFKNVKIVCSLPKPNTTKQEQTLKISQPSSPLPVLRGRYCQVWSSSRCAVVCSSGSRDAPTLSSASHQLVAGDIVWLTSKVFAKKVFVKLYSLLSYMGIAHAQ